MQVRKWATRVVEEFTIKGFAMDDERLKRGGSVLSRGDWTEPARSGDASGISPGRRLGRRRSVIGSGP